MDWMNESIPIGNLATTGWGLALGACVVGLISGIMKWMMHSTVPKEVEEVVEEVEEELADVLQRILIPTLGEHFSDRMVEMACMMAERRNAGLTALYVIEVPMTLPPEAEVPEAEKSALTALTHAQAIAERHGKTVETRIVKSRDAGRAIIDLLTSEDFTLVMIPARHRTDHGHFTLGSTVEWVIHHAPCDVMVDVPQPNNSH